MSGPDTIPSDPPVSLDVAARAGLLVAWIVVPLAEGIVVFDRAGIS